MNFDNQITNLKEGKKFIRALYKANKNFHLDDDAREVFDFVTNKKVFNNKDAFLVNQRVQELHNLDWGMFEDCHGYNLMILNSIEIDGIEGLVC